MVWDAVCICIGTYHGNESNIKLVRAMIDDL